MNHSTQSTVRPNLSIEQLEAGEIDAGSFNHEGHVYLAWCYLDAYPTAAAIERFRGALQRLVKKLGVEGKYHETITWFYLLVISERRRKPGGDNWATFKYDNEDLFAREENVLGRYYSKQCLESNEARTGFVLPDRVAA